MVKKMKQLTREQILKQTKMKIVTVPVPAWGGSVDIREWTTKERSDFEFSISSDGDDNERMRAMRECAVIASCVTPDGKMMFKTEDKAGLSILSSAATDTIFTAVSKLNGITKEDEKELVKNSKKASG